ncbi:hypothetical protein V6N11_079231 [Hibiscus sabdariffa]|uniref:Uncharacterized protein n=1 Tax=Hibiscus sabdariffa TaxID=183260 RepID=A0ABR2RUT9_9ROSI
MHGSWIHKAEYNYCISLIINKLTCNSFLPLFNEKSVVVGTGLLSIDNYVESLVLLDKTVDVRCESDVNHPIYSSDSGESSGVASDRKNEEVLLHMHNAKMTSLDLNSQQIEASLDLNSQQIELHVVDVGAHLLYVKSYVEGLVLLDKAVNVRSESDACLSNLLLEVYRHSNTDIFPKKSIPAAVAVNLAEEMGKVGPNSSPSFAAILQLALQREYQDSTGKIAIGSHIS